MEEGKELVEEEKQEVVEETVQLQSLCEKRILKCRYQSPPLPPFYFPPSLAEHCRSGPAGRPTGRPGRRCDMIISA